MKSHRIYFRSLAVLLPILLLILLSSFKTQGLIPEAWKPASIPDDSLLIKKEVISLEDAIFRGTTPEETLNEYLKTYDFLIAKPVVSDQGEVIKTHAMVLRKSLHLQYPVKLNIALILTGKQYLTVYTYASEKKKGLHNWQRLSIESRQHLDVYLTRFTKGLQRCVNRDKPKLKTVLIMPDTSANAALEQIGIQGKKITDIK